MTTLVDGFQSRESQFAERTEVQKAALRRMMMGNGAFMIFAALVGGLGLWIYLLGGFELIPGYVLQFQLPGSPDGWKRAHIGPVMNGLMVIAIAFGLPLLNISERTARILGWIRRVVERRFLLLQQFLAEPRPSVRRKPSRAGRRI